jgi:acetoacetyl-CoA synthetase
LVTALWASCRTCPNPSSLCWLQSSLGATWSSCSPDFGIKGVLDRFGQIQAESFVHRRRLFFQRETASTPWSVSGEDQEQIDSAKKYRRDTLYTSGAEYQRDHKAACCLEDFKQSADPPITGFEQVPFDHPLYIMYSSGTTGLPKCMVQSAGGILLHQMKEHLISTPT